MNRKVAVSKCHTQKTSVAKQKVDKKEDKINTAAAGPAHVHSPQRQFIPLRSPTSFVHFEIEKNRIQSSEVCAGTLTSR